MSISVRIAKKTKEAEDIFSFELVREDGGDLPEFTAGAHIEVKVSPDITRHYSLCNNPSERHRYLIGVLRDPKSRGGSIMMHALNQGDVITISEPKNLFELAPAKRYLLLAGGIGVTPILSMAEWLHQVGSDFAMHYCARSSTRSAFYKQMSSAGYSNKVKFHFDDASSEGTFDIKQLLASEPRDTHIYICGPTGFIDFVINAAKEQGWPEVQIHREYFGIAQKDPEDNSEFEVKIASSGAVFKVPVNKSIVQVLGQNGIDIPVSCEQGICGTCVTGVLDGTPEHYDMFFTDDERAENDKITPCCSRSKTKVLVLDL